MSRSPTERPTTPAGPGLGAAESRTFPPPRRSWKEYAKLAGGLAITLVYLSPFLVAISASLQTEAQLVAARPRFIPPTPMLDNYVTAFQTQLGPMLTSLRIGLLSALLCLSIAVPAAYALALFRWWWTGAVILVLLILQMTPGVTIVTPIFLLFNQLGLLNTLTGLVLANATGGVPFAILVLRAFMGTVPHDLREAALVDGASDFRILRSIYVPVARTGVIAVGIFTFLFAWADFLLALALNPSGEIVPLTIAIYDYFDVYTVDWPGVMATAVIATLPGLILLVAAQRYIAAGLSAGSVKG
jgi:multiple sugar transport system permease protein